MLEDKQIIIDGTQCRYAHFDGGNTQRLLCAIDDCFCDCHRENECYYKQLKRTEFVLQQADQNINDLESMLENTERRENELKIKLSNKEQECEELKKANKHIEHNRTQKADKLMRIEKLITACSTGYTDDFIQSILAILLEAELTEE